MNPTSSENSNSNGVSKGWGNMFKTALNQVESHLDRYLELPNEPPPATARLRQQALRHKQSAAVLGSSERPASPVDVPPRPHSRATAANNSRQVPRSATPVHHPLLSSSQTDIDNVLQKKQPTVIAKDKGMDTDLVDAFGLDDDGGVESSSSSATKPDTKTSEANKIIQSEIDKLGAAPVPSTTGDMQKTIAEYSDRIQSLLLEGQQWTNTELRLSTTIKRLQNDMRAIEKSNQLLQRKLDTELAKSKGPSGRLGQSTATDSTKALKARISEGDAQRKALEREVRSVSDARNSLRMALNTTETELANVRTELAAMRARHGTEIRQVRDTCQADADTRVAQLRAESERTQERLQTEIGELQQKVMVIEETAREREVASLTRVKTLQTQLRSAQTQSSEMTVEIQQHTKPLLQQIEEMQARQSDMRQEWSKKEGEWDGRVRKAVGETDRLNRLLDERAKDVERAQQATQTEVDNREGVEKEASKLREQLKTTDKMRRDLKLQLEEANASIRSLNVKLDDMSKPAAATAATATAASESVVEISPLKEESVNSSTPSSVDGQHTNVQHQKSPQATDKSAKILNAQITSLKAQLHTAQQQKNDYSQNMANMSMELERMREEARQHNSMARSLQDLKHRHETALEMLGEKTEEVMELQTDIKEMKEAFKQQLDSLA